MFGFTWNHRVLRCTICGTARNRFTWNIRRARLEFSVTRFCGIIASVTATLVICNFLNYMTLL